MSAGAGGVSVYGGVSARAGGVPVYGGGSGARRPGEETCRSWRLGGVHCEVAAGVTLRHWRGRVRAWGARVRRGPWPRPSRNPGLRGGRGPSGLRAGGGAGAARDGGLGGGRGPLGTAGWGEPSGRRAGGGRSERRAGGPLGTADTSGAESAAGQSEVGLRSSVHSLGDAGPGAGYFGAEHLCTGVCRPLAWGTMKPAAAHSLLLRSLCLALCCFGGARASLRR